MSKGRLARKVSVIGAAYTPLGDVRTTPGIKDFSERELVAMACIDAMKNGGIEAKDIDAFYVGMSGPSSAKIKGAAPFFAEWIGMRYKPTMFVDAGCVSTGVCLNAAVGAIASGMYDCVLVTGVNINFSQPQAGYPPYVREPLSNTELWDNVYMGVDAAYLAPSTNGLAGYEADVFPYLKKYGYSSEDFDEALISYLISKRKEAVLNPKAALATETYDEIAGRVGLSSGHDYLKSKKYNPFISALGRGQDMGWAQDCASACIVCASEIAHRYTDKPVEVAGISVSCASDKDHFGMENPDDMKMFREAYAMADITDPYHLIDHMYIHDCPAISVPIIIEEAGYVKPGETLRHMMRGDLCFDGTRPLNTTGGRTQAGHPRGPAYLIEISESIDQMRGVCGGRQMPTPPETSVLWGGGSGITKVVTVLKKQW